MPTHHSKIHSTPLDPSVPALATRVDASDRYRWMDGSNLVCRNETCDADARRAPRDGIGIPRAAVARVADGVIIDRVRSFVPSRSVPRRTVPRVGRV